MTRLIDLTATLDPANRAKLPPPLAGAAKVVAPAIEYLHPAEKGRDAFCAYLGCKHEDLPDGEGWGEEVLTDMSSHCGTHVDAPLHSGSRIAVVLGQFTNYKLAPHDKGFKLQSVVDWLRTQIKAPVLTNLPFGHVQTKVLLPVGAKVSLSVEDRDALLYWGHQH